MNRKAYSIASGGKRPRYYVARATIGNPLNLNIVCEAPSKFDADEIATALNALDDPAFAVRHQTSADASSASFRQAAE